MEGGVRTRRRSMLTRRCVACGHDVAPLDLVDGRCGACDCDFAARPPRTYAELEGFEPVPEAFPVPFTTPATLAAERPRPRRLLVRWAIFVGMLVAGSTILLAIMHAARG